MPWEVPVSAKRFVGFLGRARLAARSTLRVSRSTSIETANCQGFREDLAMIGRRVTFRFQIGDGLGAELGAGHHRRGSSRLAWCPVPWFILSAVICVSIFFCLASGGRFASRRILRPWRAGSMPPRSRKCFSSASRARPCSPAYCRVSRGSPSASGSGDSCRPHPRLRRTLPWR